jgi:hypothetical protein
MYEVMAQSIAWPDTAPAKRCWTPTLNRPSRCWKTRCGGRALGERYLTGVALVSVASVRSRHGDPRQALEIFRDAVQHWHRAGNWTQQGTTVRNVVGLLVRLGADEPAALLYGAVSTHSTAAPVFGAGEIFPRGRHGPMNTASCHVRVTQPTPEKLARPAEPPRHPRRGRSPGATSQ